MDYNVRKDYIASVLCVNRDKPILKCDGKCYLAKKLKAEREKSDPEINFKGSISLFYHTVFTQLDCLRYYQCIDKSYASVVDGCTRQGYELLVYKPPKV